MTPETNHTKQPRRSWWGIAGDVFLNTLAVGGIICIALVACAFVFNITLINIIDTIFTTIFFNRI